MNGSVSPQDNGKEQQREDRDAMEGMDRKENSSTFLPKSVQLSCLQRVNTIPTYGNRASFSPLINVSTPACSTPCRRTDFGVFLFLVFFFNFTSIAK